MDIINKDLKRRVIELSYKYQLSHISSCLTSIDLIDAIYQIRKSHDPFILSNGHAGVALYVILEKYMGLNADKLFEENGVHPNRSDHIYCSTGSLGFGLPVGVGMAIGNSNNVYVLTSDGEWMEGSMWESLRLAAELQLKNLFIYVNANGLGAYKEIDSSRLQWEIGSFLINTCPKVAFLKTDVNIYPSWLQGIAGHYVVLDKKKYEKIMEVLA